MGTHDSDILEYLNGEDQPTDALPQTEGLRSIEVMSGNESVIFHLEGNRLLNPTAVLDKVYSVYDSKLLLEAVEKLIEYYNTNVEEN